MKTEWIAYGADMRSDAGWRVLGKSSGVTELDQELFVELCRSVPLPEPETGQQQVYFGAARKGRCFLCAGEYVGRDHFGREGAWVLRGFIVSAEVQISSPYRLTLRLLQQFPAMESTEPIDLDGVVLPSPPEARVDFMELFNDRGHLVFAIVRAGLDETGGAVDGVVGARKGRFLSYVFPAGRETLRFDIVGLPLDAVAPGSHLVPVAVGDPARRWWKRAAAALAVCAVLGAALGAWGCAAIGAGRREREDYQRQLRIMDAKLSELHMAAEKLRHLRTEQNVEFGQVLSSDPHQVESFAVKIGVTTYTFSREDSAAVVTGLSGLLDEVEALRKTLGRPGQVTHDGTE